MKAKNKEFQLIVSSHTILEIYSVLTGAPFKPKITPIIAKQLIENNVKNIAKTIYLTDEDAFKIVDKMFDSNFSGGLIYDAIVVECALKAKVDEILTLNSKDFLRLTDKISIKVTTF
jgi:predicted nucleic acid-binding protein